jgi:hypothetical protein
MGHGTEYNCVKNFNFPGFGPPTQIWYCAVSHRAEAGYTTKVGAIIKKVLIEAIPMLYYPRKVSIKRLYRFKSQKF